MSEDFQARRVGSRAPVSLASAPTGLLHDSPSASSVKAEALPAFATGPLRQRAPTPQALGNLLRTTPLFASLGEEAAQALGRHCRKLRFSRHAHVVDQGGKAHALHILLQGSAQMFRTGPDGREVIITVLTAGQHFGELALIDGLPHSSTVRCEEPCDVLEIQASAFAACLVHHPSVAMALNLLLVGRLREAHRRISSLAHHGVRERLHQQLLEMAVLEQGQPVLAAPVIRRDLAKMIGASREMVSRTMGQFEDQGVLRRRPDGRWQIAPLDCGDEPARS